MARLERPEWGWKGSRDLFLPIEITTSDLSTFVASTTEVASITGTGEQVTTSGKVAREREMLYPSNTNYPSMATATIQCGERLDRDTANSTIQSRESQLNHINHHVPTESQKCEHDTIFIPHSAPCNIPAILTSSLSPRAPHTHVSTHPSTRGRQRHRRRQRDQHQHQQPRCWQHR